MLHKNKLDFSDFFSISSEKWKGKILDELKIKSDHNLLWNFNDINIQPFYTKQDLNQLKHLETFHEKFKNLSSRKWYTREVIKVINEKEANNLALHSLNNGADAIAFDLHDFNFNEKSIHTLLKDIYYNISPAHFYISEKPLILADALLKNTQTPFNKMLGSINYDPIALSLSGKQFKENSFDDLSKIFAAFNKNIHFKILTISNLHSHKTNKGPAEEIASTLSAALEYIDRMTEKNIPLDQVLSKVEFSIWIGKSYFIEIAKLRALRLLWDKIVKAYKSDFQSISTPLHCQTSEFTKSTDPYKNILINTTEAMSAIIGGCDSLSIIPFDKNIKEANEFSSRISRNISLILKEEASFGKVIDPAAGSYYIEKLTDEIAKKSWAILKDIEKAGGFIKAHKNKLIK